MLCRSVLLFRLPFVTTALLLFIAAPLAEGLPAGTHASANLPSYVVTVASDDTNGSPGNCTNQSSPGAKPDASCSLRDALAAAATGGGTITFSTTVFGAAQPVSARTITLGAGGSLTVPSNTSVTGLTSGSGATLTDLVTVAGDVDGRTSAFTIEKGTTNAALSFLTVIQGGSSIVNDGDLSLTGLQVSNAGQGVENDADGMLTLLDSMVSHNGGGGVLNSGEIDIINTTIANNTGYQGIGIFNAAGATLTLVNSSVTGNSLPFGYEGGTVGAGILNLAETMTVANSILSDNTYNSAESGSSYVEDDCDGAGCPTNGVNGDFVGASIFAPVICGGLLANIPAGITTDQRGLPRTTVYATAKGNVTCVDSGEIQAHYALSFVQQPPATVDTNVGFMASVLVSEGGAPYTPGYPSPLSLALADGDNGTLSNGSAAANGFTGIASFTNLLVNAAGTDDNLVASITVGTTPAPASTPLTVSAASSAFDVQPFAAVQVTIGATPGILAFTVDGTTYNSAVTLGWPIGSKHTIATSSPQTVAGQTYTFTGWSDGGALSHMVTATASTTYTATFLLGSLPVVNTAADDATGVAANCAQGSTTPCTLRDALAAAAAVSPGMISFDPKVFAASQPVAARTIKLIGGPLDVAGGTTVTGPTAGSGLTLTNLVTVDGNNQSTVFLTGSEGFGSMLLANLTITDGQDPYAAGINSGGELTVSNCNIAGNNGPGIGNFGELTLIDSTVTGNSGADGGAISNDYNVDRFVTIINSTISGNNGGSSTGAAIYTETTLTIMNSTILGAAGAIDDETLAGIGGPLTVTNNIVEGACSSPQQGVCSGLASNGNVMVTNSQLAPLGNYGGPTQTQPPLPGSPAICAGLLADIPPGVSTDQRGQPRTSTYGGTTCVDAGAVQTHYSISFATQPAASVAVGAKFSAAVQLSESGRPFEVSGVGIPLALGSGDAGTLSGNMASTAVSGVATYNALSVSAPGSGDTLVASLLLTGTPLPAAITTPIETTATSQPFTVTPNAYGFSISASPLSLTVQQGQTGTAMISLSPQGGYSGVVQFSCSTPSAQVSCSFVPAAVTLSGSSKVVSTTLVVKVGRVVGALSPAAGSQALSSTMLLCWLPGGVLGLGLFFGKKHVSLWNRRLLGMMVLIAVASGTLVQSLPTPRPVATSIVTITASGTGGISQSLRVGINITN